jgi:hypothetical protein
VLILSAFRLQFPEFDKVSDPQVNAALARAALEINVDVWGTKQDTGHGLLAAHLLAISPMGQMARMSSKEGDSTYGKQYRDNQATVAGLIFRVS